jgi:hypothetical protein
MVMAITARACTLWDPIGRCIIWLFVMDNLLYDLLGRGNNDPPGVILKNSTGIVKTVPIQLPETGTS